MTQLITFVKRQLYTHNKSSSIELPVCISRLSLFMVRLVYFYLNTYNIKSIIKANTIFDKYYSIPWYWYAQLAVFSDFKILIYVLTEFFSPSLVSFLTGSIYIWKLNLSPINHQVDVVFSPPLPNFYFYNLCKRKLWKNIYCGSTFSWFLCLCCSSAWRKSCMKHLVKTYTHHGPQVTVLTFNYWPLWLWLWIHLSTCSHEGQFRRKISCRTKSYNKNPSGTPRWSLHHNMTLLVRSTGLPDNTQDDMCLDNLCNI